MLQNSALSRRAALGSVISIGTSAALAMRPATPVAPAQFRDRLRGPILSVPAVFNARFEVDSSGIRRVIDTGLRAGCGTVALTSGNCQYDRLTYSEIKELTRTVINAVAGRAMTIAATGPWWTGQATDYARFAESLGADAVQVMLPTYGNDDTLFEHFRTIASATRRAIVLHGQVPLPLLGRLLQIESIVAYKEEYTPLYSVDVFAHYAKRLNIFAGGQNSRFLMYRPYGMKAYYSTLSTFAPALERRFWDAVQADDLDSARAVILKYEVPFFERWSHAFWRATMEYFGIARRFLRPPDPSFSQAQVAALGSFYNALGVRRENS